MRTSTALFLAMFLAGAAITALSACSVTAQDGNVTAGPAASSLDLGKVGDALFDETEERIEADDKLRVEMQDGDKAVAAAVEQATSDLAAGVDPSIALAAFKTEQAALMATALREARSDADRELAKRDGQITALKESLNQQQLLFGIGASLLGVGGVGGAFASRKTGKRLGRMEAMTPAGQPVQPTAG